MLARTFILFLALMLLAGCQHAGVSSRSSMPVSAVDASAPARCQLNTGEEVLRRELRNGETISGVLDQVLPATAPDEQHRTVILLRRSPEGYTQALIDVDADGRPVDPAKDVILRDGDELILPSQAIVPRGLERPSILSGEMPR